MGHRSIRIEGTTTSLAMEPAFWEELDRRADQAGLSWQEYTRHLLEGFGVVPNRASAIKESLVYQLKEEQAEDLVPQSWQLLMNGINHRVETNKTRLLVGRGRGNHLLIDDPQVSRRHLVLVHDSKHWWAVDLGSRNGSFIGGRKFSNQRLVKNDSIKLGDSRLTML